jgi:hypothetical protein
VIAGVVLLDLGIQGQHILNQSTIYGLRDDARSRVTTAYMAFNFLFGALGSAAASVAWSAGGWGAVSGLGLGLAVVGLALWGLEQLQRSRAGAGAEASARPETTT